MPFWEQGGSGPVADRPISKCRIQDGQFLHDPSMEATKGRLAMRIECPNCDRVYNIPDERIPKEQGIAFPCPACGGIISIDLRARSSKDGSPASPKNDLPRGEALKARILKTVQDLPPMPQSILKAREIMRDPHSSFGDIAAALETDQALATKVLKLANSPYYGCAGKVSSLKQASVVLGVKTLEEMIAVAGTSRFIGKDLEGYQLGAGDLWHHSLGVAVGAKIIANRRNPAIAGDAFTAGLIHDVGKLALAPYLLERKEVFDAFMAKGNESFLRAEKQILGFDHGEVASELCKRWNVPDNLTAPIRYHHSPSRAQGNELVYMVHLADIIAMMSGLGAGVDGMFYEMDDRSLEFLGLQEEEMNGIMIEVVESVQEIVAEMPEG